MSVHGDVSSFSDFFPDGLVPDILELVVTCWKAFLKPKPTDLEVPISRRFTAALRREKASQELPFSIWPESSEADSETGEEIGRIDIRFLPGHREDIYFAFECKRLRFPGNPKMIPGTSKYVGNEGIMRFVTGKYGKGLTDGGMIGYVMDGRTALAILSVRNLIEKKRGELCLSEGTSLGTSTILPKEKTIKETLHDFSDRQFTIHHVFLGV